jgi:MFS family permease
MMSTATHAATLPLTDDAALFTHPRRAACVGAVTLVSLLAFEALAVAAAMPAISAALDGDALYAMAFGGMLAASLIGMVLAGRLCDHRGAWLSSAIGLAVFALGLVLAGAAHGMVLVVGGRVVQGLGGGMLGVALYVGMGQLVPRALHPRLFALFAAAWVLPGLLGPPIAAALVAQLGWRSVFLAVALVVPLAGALLLPALMRLPAPGTGTPGRAPHQALSWAMLAVGGALLLHAAGGLGGQWPAQVALLIGSVLTLVAARELLPRGTLLAARGLPTVIALRGLLAAGFATAEAFVPLYLTRMQGWSLGSAGLALSTGAVLWSAGSAVQSRLQSEAVRRRGLAAGLALNAMGIALAALPASFGLPSQVLLVGWAIAGFGIGLAFPMLSVLTLRLSPPGEQGYHASALQLSDALCCSAALAVAGQLFARGGGAFADVLLLAAALPAAGALLARRVC